MKSKVVRKSTTIVAADIVGYGKLINHDEEGTLSHFRTIMRRFVRPTIVRHSGRLFKFVGDTILADFANPSDALHCAVQIQSDLTIHNATVPEGSKMFFRMGLHWGEVTLEGEDVLGDTVNIASRLEGLSKTGGIIVSGAVRDSLASTEGIAFSDSGTHELKNISELVRYYEVKFDPAVYAATSTVSVMQPYRGLQAFREVDYDLFYGRETFVDLLVEAVQEKSLVAVIGSSGSGKSSVVAAGLLPRMRSKNWLIAQFRPGSQPFVELANALQPLLLPDVSQVARRSATQSLSDALTRGELRLADLRIQLHRVYPEAPGILIVADQFEEFLTLCTDRLQRETFQDLIVSDRRLGDDESGNGVAGLPMVIVTTLRADFMGRFLDYRPLADAMQDGDIKLGPMTRSELQRTIENPARNQGIGFAPGLVERILDDVGEEPGNLPLLQFALTALWDKDAELGAELSHQAYEEIGRVQGALAYHAEDVFNALQPKQQLLAQEIFVQLVQPGEGVASTRRVATREELGEESWQLVQRLADSRLVITGRNTNGDETVEVVHEALIRDWDRLRVWLNESFSFRSWQERLRWAIGQWQESGEDKGGLLRGASLAEAVGWLETHGNRMNSVEKQYIEHGKNLLQEQQRIEKQQYQRELDLENAQKTERKLRSLTRALAGVLCISLATAVFAWLQQRSAVEARTLAEAERVVAQEARELTDEALKVTEAARKDAEEAREIVELAKEEVDTLNRQILAQQLSAETVLANDNPADRASGLPLLLGMEAVRATLVEDGTSLWVANNALREAVRTAPRKPWRKLVGHKGKVESVHFSANGKKLITGGNDKLVNIWDVESNTLLFSLEGHQQRVTQALFVDDDKTVVSTSMDGTLRKWDAVTGALVQTLKNHEGAIYDLVISEDNRYWSTISYDGTAQIIDAESGELISELVGQKEPLYTVAFSPNGQRVATAGDSTAALWDTKSGDLIQMLDTDVTAVRSVQFSADNQLLILRGEDNIIDIRDGRSGDIRYTLSGHDESAIWSATFSPDDRHILTAGGDGTVRIWEASTGIPVRTFVGHEEAVSTATYNITGELIASAGSDGAAIIWDAQTAKILGVLEGHQSAVSAIVFRQDGQWIATAGEDGSAVIWNVDQLNGQVIANNSTLNGHGGGGQAIAFDPRADRAVTGAYNGSVLLWHTETGEYLGTLPDSTDGIYSLAFSPDGTQIAGVGASGDLYVWDPDTLSLVYESEVSSAANLWTEFSHNGKFIATTSVNGTASIVDARDGGIVHVLDEHEGALFWAGFSPDDKLLATASYADNTVRVWDVETGNTLHVLAGHSGGIYRSGFSSDGKYLVTASNDTTAKVWDMKTGSIVLDLLGHTSTVRAAQYSPDGKVIVTASYDNTAKIWDSETGAVLHTLTGHQANLMSIDFSPDSSWFLTTSYDTTVKIWETRSGDALHTLEGHGDKLEYAVVSPDGRRIISQGHDDKPRIWYSQITDLIEQANQKLPRQNPYFSTDELRRFRLGDLLERRVDAEAEIELARESSRNGKMIAAADHLVQAQSIDLSSLIMHPEHNQLKNVVVQIKGEIESSNVEVGAGRLDELKAAMDKLERELNSDS